MRALLLLLLLASCGSVTLGGSVDGSTSTDEGQKTDTPRVALDAGASLSEVLKLDRCIQVCADFCAPPHPDAIGCTCYCNP